MQKIRLTQGFRTGVRVGRGAAATRAMVEKMEARKQSLTALLRVLLEDRPARPAVPVKKSIWRY